MRQRKSTEKTNFSAERAPQRRGPRSELTDDKLHDRRDQLVQAFEGAWGNIGWELQTCKKADDLASIFTPLLDTFAQNIISVFCDFSTETASAATLRKLRRELRSLVPKRHSAEESKYVAQEQLRQADVAFAQASESQQGIIKREHEKRMQEAKGTAEESRGLLEAEHQLEWRIHRLEANFACEQLFLFLKSRRYTLTPMSLANAIAGLPYIGWRQSMRRCAPMRYAQSPLRAVAVDRLAYQIFKAICYIPAAVYTKTEDEVVTTFREGIPLLPIKHRLAKAELATNWLYLESAIREAYRIRPNPKAFPFEIQKRYLRQIRSRSPLDMILAEGSKIQL